MNLLKKEAAHQWANYLKYKKLNKSFAKKNTRKEETAIIDDTSDSDFSSSSEDHNSCDEDKEASITYDLESVDNDKSSNSSIDSKENIWNNGCRYGFIIDKVEPNSKSKIK